MNRSTIAPLLSACLVPALAAAEPATLKPRGAGQPVALEGSFGFKGRDEKKLRRSASGIACLSPTNCLVALDEGGEARRAALSPSGYRAGAAVALPVEGEEGDAEAVAADSGRFYVTGSHSVKRSDCAPNAASRFVARVEANGEVARGSILPAIEAVPELKAALGQCLKDGRGLDVEGLAASGEHLWFGFRGPPAPIHGARPEDGGAHVLRVDREAVFNGGDLRPETLVANVGAGRTIRDMQAVGDRLLLLAGPPRGVDDPVGYALVLFDPKAPAKSTVLGTLDFSGVERREAPGCKDEKRLAEVKPEGLMVADPAAATWEVAILSDGLCDGGPIWFEIAR